MNSLYDIVFMMARNFCYSNIFCETCSRRCKRDFLSKKVPKYLCRLKSNNCLVDNIISIMSDYSYPKKNPLWDILLKECNEHFRYGRFDCCYNCKFYKEKLCFFSMVWWKL